MSDWEGDFFHADDDVYRHRSRVDEAAMASIMMLQDITRLRLL
jgi:hypothetical protein